ncbi:hypothetical protein BGZ90_011672 [Linnemannia elongata]|nr:hypothetical protein BGZ90_011672 [Linnemannia elongata]
MDEEDELMELHESCISTRKQIIAQLAKLTSLKYLSLGSDFKTGGDIFENRLDLKHVYKCPRNGGTSVQYDDILPDTFHLSLDTDLDQLVNHHLDTAEIEWKAREFPRLKEMRGLVTQSYIEVEPNPKVDALIALLRRLRSDVAQRQRFGGYRIPATPFGEPSKGTLFRST